MTTRNKVARRELSLLQLASDLKNVSKACKVMGYYQTFGADGLIDRLPGPRGPHPNQDAEEIEKAILDHCLKHPSHGCRRVADELAMGGVQVSSSGVRGVWTRHDLLTKEKRLLRLEKEVTDRGSS